MSWIILIVSIAAGTVAAFVKYIYELTSIKRLTSFARSETSKFLNPDYTKSKEFKLLYLK